MKKSEVFRVRVPEALAKRIYAYMKKTDLNASRALQNLIAAGLESGRKA